MDQSDLILMAVGFCRNWTEDVLGIKTQIGEIKGDLETVKERNDYYQGRAKDLQDAVDQELQRENAHNTMTISKPDRQSRVNFGGPLKE